MSDDIQETPSTTSDLQTELARQLQELVPEAIADGKVDVAKLEELLDESKRRRKKNAKIKTATKHFKQLGTGDEAVPGYAVSASGNWGL